MKAKIAALGMCGAGLLLGGCSVFTPLAEKHALEPGKSYWFDYDGSRRGALMVQQSDGKISVCAEPPPDVALKLALNSNGSLGVNAGDGGTPSVNVAGALSDNVDVQQLFQRSQAADFVRTAFFALCQAGLNQQIKPDDMVKLLVQVMGIANNLEQAEIQKAHAVAQRAEANAQNAKANADQVHTAKLQALDKLLREHKNDPLLQEPSIQKLLQ